MFFTSNRWDFQILKSFTKKEALVKERMSKRSLKEESKDKIADALESISFSIDAINPPPVLLISSIAEKLDNLNYIEEHLSNNTKKLRGVKKALQGIERQLGRLADHFCDEEEEN